MNKKKKRIKLILILSIILLVIIIISRVIVLNIQKGKKEYNALTDFETIQDVAQCYQSKIIKEKSSDSENFSQDIYINFKYNTYTDDISNEFYYKSVIDRMAYVLKYENFRLIDDEKELLIAVICNKEEKCVLGIFVNGDINYFNNRDSKINLKNSNDKTTEIQIQAKEILNLMEYNWYTVKVKLGTIENKIENYEIYEDEGLEVRKVYKRVFNIVFNTNYKNTVINDIKVGTSFEEIIRKLGEPTFKSGNSLIGYKSKDIYAFFTIDDISIYRVEQADSTEFLKLVEKFQKDVNVKEFVTGITDMWKDYDVYNYNKTYVDLRYSLKGVKIQFNITEDHGVIFTNNYIGNIGTDISKQDILEGKKTIPKYTFLENIDSVYEAEQQRNEDKYFRNNIEGEY